MMAVTPRKKLSQSSIKASRKPLKNAPAYLRFYLIAGVLSVGFGAVLFSLAKNQIVAGEEGKDFLQAQGDARALRTEPMMALRGMITDRHGEPLAVSTPVSTIWVNPRVLNLALEESKRSLDDLARALGVSKKALLEKTNTRKYFVYLKRHISPVEAKRVMDLDYAGVYERREYHRFYPAAEVAAHVVGFTDIDEKGQEGMELAHNVFLKGEMGSKRVLKDLSGRVIKDVQLIKAPHAGENLRLSIDLRVQYLAYSHLEEAVEKHKAKSGSVVVLDSLTGEVLAMANYPSYNPNNRRHLRGEELRNRAVTDVFEPGSTVKPLTLIAALESGQYKPDTKINTSPGYVRVGRKTFEDKHDLGKIDLTTIIARSSQVGITKIAMSLPGNDIRNALHRVGFGEKTGSEFPGESIGFFPRLQNKWRPVEQATMAFGLGLSVTPLQLARAYSVLANNGVKQPVSLLHGSELNSSSQEASSQVVSEKISQQILSMMQQVTQKGGTATRAQVTAYTVAGKTGTTHKAIAGGYAEDQYTAVFAGMAPATAPRFVAVVMIDEPSGKSYYGGQVAAPVFSEVMAATLRLYGVAPDDLPASVASQRDNERLPG